MDALTDRQYYRTIQEQIKQEVVDFGFAEVDQVKTDVENIEFVEVDSHDVNQLCTACLCMTRTTQMLDNDTIKKYFMSILTELQLDAGEPVLQSPRLCWECVAHLKRSVRFREQVQDSYRLLKPMLLTCDKEDLAEFLQTSVCRPGRLSTCFIHSIDISAQGDDTQVMTTTEDDGDKADPLQYSENHLKTSAFQAEDLDEKFEETDACASKQVKNCVTAINTPTSNYELKSTFVCDYCYKRFTSKTAIERHIATYDIYPHNNKTVPFPCEDCVVVLCSDSQCSECSNGHRLLQSINIETNHNIAKKQYQRNVQSSQCHNHISISNKKSLILQNSFTPQGHLIREKITHIEEKPHQCEVCDKSFSRKQILVEHIKTHTGEKPFQCEVCQKSFAYQTNLVRHRKTHTGEKPFQCEVCRKSFSEKKTLVCHNRIHTGEKPFQCEVCCKSFAKKCTMLNHVRRHGEKPFQCEVCQKYFLRKQSLADHIKTHTDEKPYQCDVCRKSFVKKSNLIPHIKTHTGEKPFQCEVCHKYFLRKRSLADHIKTHTGEKPYQCDVCRKSFVKKSNMIQHRRTHTGEFQCEVCYKSYTSKHILVVHNRTHTGEKPFQCEVCQKSFAYQTNLVRHRRTHTGEKPFQCEVCRKSFALKCTMLNHLRTRHTGEKPFLKKH